MPRVPPPELTEPVYPALLAPQALVELVQFVRYHAGKPRSQSRGEKGVQDDSRACSDHFSSGLHARGGDS